MLSGRGLKGDDRKGGRVSSDWKDGNFIITSNRYANFRDKRIQNENFQNAMWDADSTDYLFRL